MLHAHCQFDLLKLVCEIREIHLACFWWDFLCIGLLSYLQTTSNWPNVIMQ